MSTASKKSLYFIAFLLVVILLFCPVDMRRGQISPTLLARDGSLLRAYPSSDDQIRLPVARVQVDPIFINMLLAYEDRHFFSHPGVNPFSLLRAFGQWLEAGEVISGGSTLTMQVARLLVPAPRTIWNKIQEILRAVRLEAQYNKEEILELYLQLAPYGGNITGIRAASLVYFNKEPQHLTPDEAALLVILPQNPNRFRPDRFPDRARQARAKVLRRLYETGNITQTAYNTGIASAIPHTRFPLPKLAPHLADFLQKKYTLQSPWHSTLDAKLQHQLEQSLYKHLASLSARTTIAALVIDNKTNAVLAYIGNADYLSTARAGQVNMVMAFRSPGSTLKPFAYGMAFQEGIAVPETIIRDTQTRFGDYTPNNFNQGFTGDVTIRQALQQSLNIPAVKILEAIGPQVFLNKLRATGANFKLSDQKDVSELPIILGGLGARLWDMTQLYTGLANGGVVKSIYFLNSYQDLKAHQIFDQDSAEKVTNILVSTPLSDGVARGPNSMDLAIKTGTSYGYRDAWAMGYTPEYTIGVWVGRADGTPVPGQIGRNTAIPILLSIHDSLPSTMKSWSFIKQKNDVKKIPDALRRWRGDVITSNQAVAKLILQYPVDKSILNRHEFLDNGLQLSAQGGVKPYQWYVNGHLLQPQENTKRMIWKPKNGGFYKLVVEDKQGNFSKVTVEIKD
jgi:penicillin-binding protein 1C